MRAAALTGYGRSLELMVLPDPVPPEDGAVVRVLACGICRSEFHVWNGDWRWRMQVTFLLNLVLSGMRAGHAAGLTVAIP